MARIPENSTSRSALEAAANLLALVESAIGTDANLHPDEAMVRVVGVLRNVKGLRDYQMEELVDFVSLRLSGAPFTFSPDENDPDGGRSARQLDAVDELIAAGQTTFDDLDPREAAEELAARVRGTVAPPEGADDA